MAKGIYTPDEVVTQYRQAKDRREQIHILAELQQCSEAQIVELLRERGEPVTEFPKKKSVLDTFEVVPVQPDTAVGQRRAAPIPWEPEEIERLRQYAAEGLTIAETVERLGRTWNSVTSKAHDLGIFFGKNRDREKPEPDAGEADLACAVIKKKAVADVESEPVGEPEPEAKRDIKVNPLPSRPLPFGDVLDFVTYVSALMDDDPVKVTIEGECVMALFPRGMVSLRACLWDAPGAKKEAIG